MQTAAIYIRTEPETKKQAQKVAQQIGMSLSGLVNASLKQIIKTKKVEFSAEEPNEYFKRTLAKARKNWKEGKGSPIFNNIEDDLKWLEKQGI